ncbi:MAG: hypothetical protein P8Z49_02345 [Acidobacteriota bacterium]
MKMIKAIKNGFFSGKGKFLCAALFYLAGAIFAYVGLAPLRHGLHKALDYVNGATHPALNGGLPALIEISMGDKSFWTMGISLVGFALLVLLPVALFLTAGTYGLAAEAFEKPVRRFWGAASSQFWPFAALTIFNILYWVVLGIPAAFWFAGSRMIGQEHETFVTSYRLFIINMVVLFVVVVLIRNVMNFTLAQYSVTPGRGVGRNFLHGLGFAWRRFFPVSFITVLFMGLRWATVWIFAVLLSAGFSSPGRWWLSAVLLQIGWFIAAFLRVAEIRASVKYCGAFSWAEPPVEEKAPASPAHQVSVDDLSSTSL